MVRRLLVLLLIASPTLCAADKTTEVMLEVLRDVAGLQDQIKALQKSLEGKLADLGQASAEQARISAEQTGTALTALTDKLQKSLQGQQDQQAKALESVAALGSQVQAVSDQLSIVRQALNDLTATMNRLNTQVNDLTTAVKSAQPAKSDASGATPQPEISATDLLASAEGDRLGGKLALALQEYSEYVTKFGTTPQAGDAQYYIGSIHYSNAEWEDAAKAFTVLLETYPDSKRTPESLYYKADSLARLGRWPEANDAFADLRKRFPNSTLAKRGLTVKPPR